MSSGYVTVLGVSSQQLAKSFSERFGIEPEEAAARIERICRRMEQRTALQTEKLAAAELSRLELLARTLSPEPASAEVVVAPLWVTSTTDPAKVTEHPERMRSYFTAAQWTEIRELDARAKAGSAVHRRQLRFRLRAAEKQAQDRLAAADLLDNLTPRRPLPDTALTARLKCTLGKLADIRDGVRESFDEKMWQEVATLQSELEAAAVADRITVVLAELGYVVEPVEVTTVTGGRLRAWHRQWTRHAVNVLMNDEGTEVTTQLVRTSDTSHLEDGDVQQTWCANLAQLHDRLATDQILIESTEVVGLRDGRLPLDESARIASMPESTEANLRRMRRMS